jgi:hypothetical protein
VKIRLMGPEDVVRAWAARLGQHLGAAGDFYPMRGGWGLRWYVDIDDRVAAEVVEQPGPPPPRRRRVAAENT